MQMNDSVVISYSGQQVSVPKEVADFLEQDRKREQAQEKQNKRHLSKSAFETVLSSSDCVRRPVEDAVLWNLQLETLRKAVDELGEQDRDLIQLRYGGLTMEEIGTIYGVSKAAVSKRLKKLHEQLMGSVK
ncbi:sigma-70, region 4 [Oscillibacter sp. KLE 1728]|nr:sigma-70, region 4 [Oscillibacter sp. KLE 1728]